MSSSSVGGEKYESWVNQLAVIQQVTPESSLVVSLERKITEYEQRISAEAANQEDKNPEA